VPQKLYRLEELSPKGKGEMGGLKKPSASMETSRAGKPYVEARSRRRRAALPMPPGGPRMTFRAT